MAHLIDANCFIQPKNDYYGFDFCPGYWNWIEQQNQLGNVFSIDKIGDELKCGNDELAEWSKGRDSTFFLSTDTSALSSMAQISAWVAGANFRPHAIPVFMSCADPFLIAYALAHGYTVVTHERIIPNETKKVKIPVVCQHFHVPCITIFDLFRSTGKKLELGGS